MHWRTPSLTKTSSPSPSPATSLVKVAVVLPTQCTGLACITNPKRVGDIHWNFEKFLVGRDGRPRARFHPTVTDPEALVDDIANLLYEKPSGGPSNKGRSPRATTVSL